MKNNGWVVVVFEVEPKNQVAYVKGPFPYYEDAEDWAENSKHCAHGEFQITFIEYPQAKAA